MSRFVRPSSYRHVYGQPSKVSYENAKISGSAWDTNLVTAGGKYIALNWQVSGGGAFAILPSFSPWDIPEAESFPTKLPDLLPLARGHSAPVLDTAWSPFDDNLVVSGGEDGKIFLWKVEDDLFNGWGKDGWEPEDLAPVGKLNAGGRKVGQVEFHPVAANLLTSASGDHLVRVWDIDADDVAITLTGHTDSIQSIAWNATGTTLATTCRDRKLRLFDPRTGTEAVRVTDGHSGIKGSRVLWLGDRDRIATTGFSKMSDRQLGLWDTSSLTNLKMESLDSSAGIIVPFFAEGNDVLFLAGKGDGNIRYYEFEGDNFHFLNEYKTSTPQRGIGFIPRRGLDVSQNEIARAFKLSGREVTPLSFIVPRKAEGFQSDIYPPANSIEPAMTAKDWLGGKNARPNVIDLETRATSANKAPISTPKASAPATPAPSTPKEEPKVEPKKEEPKVEPKKEEAKAEPKVEPKEEPKAEPKAAAPPKDDVKAKDLEIEQPDSDDEDKSKTALAAAGAGAGALAGAGAVAAAGGASTAKSTPAASSPATPSVPSTPAAETNGSGAANNSDELLVKLLSDKATLPTRGSSHAAGHDLYAAADTTVPARGQALVETGISVAVPTGTYGRVAPRSGLAVKHAIDTGAGVIDADYRGEVKVVLFNHSDKDFKIARGDRIAQLILERVHMAPLRQVDDLEATVRGSGGFGSTGGFRH